MKKINKILESIESFLLADWIEDPSLQAVVSAGMYFVVILLFIGLISWAWLAIIMTYE